MSRHPDLTLGKSSMITCMHAQRHGPGEHTIVAKVDDAAGEQDDELVEEAEGLGRGRVDGGADGDAVVGPRQCHHHLHHLPSTPYMPHVYYDVAFWGQHPS